MKQKLFNLILLVFLWNFNSLQVSVKAKWLNNKKNSWRRIEILVQKKPSLHKKFRSIYREVLSVTWPNFTVAKCNSKISDIYHHIKFRESIMNRCSMKKLLLKTSQYLQENTFVGVSFLKKKCRPSALQLYWKKTPTQAFSCEYCKMFKITCFEEHLWTAVWTFSYMNK